MAATNEPMPSRNLACLYSAQSVQGTPVTPATSPGIVTFDAGMEEDLRAIYSIGAANAKFLKPGISALNWSVNVTHVQTLAILNQGKRTSGLLPWLTWGFGYDDDATTQFAFQFADCKVGSMDISLEAGGFLSAQLSGQGIGAVSELSAFTMAFLTPVPLLSYECTFTRGGSAYIAKSLRMTINHNLQADPVIPGAAPTHRRPPYLTEGNEEISGEITRFAKSGVTMQATTQAEATLQLSCVDIAGGMSPNTIVIALVGAKLGAERLVGEENGMLMFSTPFQCLTFTVA